MDLSEETKERKEKVNLKTRCLCFMLFKAFHFIVVFLLAPGSWWDRYPHMIISQIALHDDRIQSLSTRKKGI